MGRLSRLPLGVLVFVAGTGSLGAEIAAVRLLAPYFGDSTIVWANTIGIVLVALSIGYWLGGKFADRHPHRQGLHLLTLAAASILAILPFVADPILRVGVEALDSISAGAFVGSLLAVLLLLAFPTMLLGAVSPWAIRLAVTGVDRAGEVAGRLYALSTAGSLLGTLASALVLIPLVGTRRTFLVFAFAIAFVAVLGLLPAKRYALAPAAIVALMLIPVGTLKAAENGELVHETNTEYQYARVIEYEDERRVLELNEGQAVHSVYEPESVLTGGVWDGHTVLPFTGLEEPPERVAILGNAAGTQSRAYEKFFPEAEIDGVEIDPELSEIGRRWFDMTNPELELHHEDARPFLRRAEGGYDVISVDAYHQPYIPFYLTTVEFFELVRDRLAPDGVMIVNAGHPPGELELEQVLAATMGEVFPHVLRDPIEQENTLLVASQEEISAEALASQAGDLPAELQPLARDAAARIEGPLAGGEVYTDDDAPVEWLIDKSIINYAAGD